MGYYTDFSLDIIGYGDLDFHIESIRTFVFNDSLFNDSCKWHSCEKDMRAYSLDHPEVVFKIKGLGEENGDVWVAYFMNGKMQYHKAVIELEGFDKSKLS